MPQTDSITAKQFKVWKQRVELARADIKQAEKEANEAAQQGEATFILKKTDLRVPDYWEADFILGVERLAERLVDDHERFLRSRIRTDQAHDYSQLLVAALAPGVFLQEGYKTTPTPGGDDVRAD
jgi:hypothetical protein